jgi:hypothetical protein
MVFDAPPYSLINSIVNPKVKITKGEGVGAHSLGRSILGVEGRAGAPRWGLGRVTKQVIYSHGLAQTKQQVG